MAEKKRFFYGWLILLTCILIMGLGYAPLVSCASLFTKPVTEDLGFTRSGYALVSTIAALMMAFMSPFIGKIMSKPYMHKALVVCMIGNCLAYYCYSFASTLPQFYVTAACIGFFECGSTMIPVSGLITNYPDLAREEIDDYMQRYPQYYQYQGKGHPIHDWEPP